MNKKNLPLYIALAVPVLMIILVAAFIYLPGLAKKPKTNFIYMTGSYVYNYGNYGYQVTGGQLVYTQPPVNSPALAPASNVQFYLYDVSSNQARELSPQDAETYQLDPSSSSSDGYAVQQGNSGGGGFPFGGGNDYTDWFLVGHNRAVKLNLKLTGPSSYENFRFIGWIK